MIYKPNSFAIQPAGIHSAEIEDNMWNKKFKDMQNINNPMMHKPIMVPNVMNQGQGLQQIHPGLMNQMPRPLSPEGSDSAPLARFSGLKRFLKKTI